MERVSNQEVSLSFSGAEGYFSSSELLDKIVQGFIKQALEQILEQGLGKHVYSILKFRQMLG